MIGEDKIRRVVGLKEISIEIGRYLEWQMWGDRQIVLIRFDKVRTCQINRERVS